VLLLSVSAQFIALRSVWDPLSFSPRQFRAAYFEPSPDGVAIALDDGLVYHMLPDISVAEDGALSVPPGRSVALPLDANQRYRFQIPNAGAEVPYVVLGRVEADRFVAGRVLDAGRDLPRLRDWDAGSSWLDDAAWLAGLSSACGTPGTSKDIEVSGARLTLGPCSVVLSPGRGGPAMLLLVAGPRWVTVRNESGGWEREHRLLSERIAGVLVLSTLFVFPLIRAGLGRAAALSLPTTLVIVHLLSPAAALLGWLLAGLLGLCALAGRVLWRLWRRPRLRYPLLGVVVLLAVLYVVAPTPLPPPPGDSGTPCLVSGYSTVLDARLRETSQGLYAHLRECRACGEAADRFASEGQNFTMLSEVACTDSLPLLRGGKLIFFGGSNDDFFWSTEDQWPLDEAKLPLILVREMTGELVTASVSEQFFADAERRSLGALDLQRDAISKTLSCLRQRTSQLYYFHDFLVTDLLAGRTPERARMVHARRDVVLAGGGEFVDLLEAFRDEVGVSWFSDTIHLSAVGHQRLADYMCTRL
jgi:hypothetical protein